MFCGLGAVPIVLLISVFYSRFLVRAYEEGGMVALLLKIASCFLVVSVLLEVGLMLNLGAAVAHDRFNPFFDRLHALNILLGPAAITNLVAILIHRQTVDNNEARFYSSAVCFLAIMCGLYSNVAVDGVVHYRTDGEGTYRITE